jgi:predicted Zn-dependent peptidase
LHSDPYSVVSFTGLTLKENKKHKLREMTQFFSRPIVSQLDKVDLPEVDMYRTASGLSFYLNNAGDSEAVKLDVLIQAGRVHESKHLVSKAVGSIISRGTSRLDRDRIDQCVDQKGAALFSLADPDLIHIGLYTSRKHVDELFPLVYEILTDPVFPETELIKFIKRGKQRLREDLKNPSVLAYRHTTEKIFGSTHPYGYNSTEETFDALRTEDLVLYYLNNVTPGRTHVILTARPDRKLETKTLRLFEKWSPKGANETVMFPKVHSEIGTAYISFQQENLQTAFCMGRMGPGRQEPNTFYTTHILSLILGGFFGSRLVRNIREEKGLAYDVHSSLDPLRFATLFTVSGECSKEEMEKVNIEIQAEMQRLREEFLDVDELAMLKNYAIGLIMNTLDGPLHTAEWLKSTIAEGASIDSIGRFVERIREVTVEELRDNARSFLIHGHFFTTWVS